MKIQICKEGLMTSVVYSIYLFSKYNGIAEIVLIHKSQNAPVSYHTMLHSEQKHAMVHSGICDIVPLYQINPLGRMTPRPHFTNRDKLLSQEG